VDEHNTPININRGPITWSRSKKLHQEVTSSDRSVRTIGSDMFEPS
jgi:hypothetical protein